MKAYVTAAMALILLAGCDPMGKIGLDWPKQKDDRPTPVVMDDPDMSEPVPEEESTPQPDESTGFLGVTVASLGDPAREGFWIETPLVSTPGKGRVTYEKSGRTVKVDMIPIEGPATAGSRLSMAAMRLLDAPLTGLAEVKLYRE